MPKQPFDPQFPQGMPRGGRRAPGTGEATDEQKKRVLWIQSRQNIAVGPGSVELSLMALPASTAIDVFISYASPGYPQTIISPNGLEVYRLYANEQLTSRLLATFSPGQDGALAGLSLPPVGRVFAIRDFPTDGWELKIDTADVHTGPPPRAGEVIGTIFVNVTCVGWAREPTGIGPHELDTLTAGQLKLDRSLHLITAGGLDAPDGPGDFEPHGFAKVPLYNWTDPFFSRFTAAPPGTDSARQCLAGASNVIICGWFDAGSGDQIVPIRTTADGQLITAPPAPAPAGTFDGGSNVPLAVANTPVRGANMPCNGGFIMISADPSNTAQIHLARLNTVTAGATGKGGSLTAGQSVILPAANTNDYWFVAAVVPQNVHLLAL